MIAIVPGERTGNETGERNTGDFSFICNILFLEEKGRRKEGRKEGERKKEKKKKKEREYKNERKRNIYFFPPSPHFLSPPFPCSTHPPTHQPIPPSIQRDTPHCKVSSLVLHPGLWLSTALSVWRWNVSFPVDSTHHCHQDTITSILYFLIINFSTS